MILTLIAMSHGGDSAHAFKPLDDRVFSKLDIKQLWLDSFRPVSMLVSQLGECMICMKTERVRAIHQAHVESRYGHWFSYKSYIHQHTHGPIWVTDSRHNCLMSNSLKTRSSRGLKVCFWLRWACAESPPWDIAIKVRIIFFSDSGSHTYHFLSWWEYVCDSTASTVLYLHPKTFNNFPPKIISPFLKFSSIIFCALSYASTIPFPTVRITGCNLQHYPKHQAASVTWSVD
jgi:hypothetical protein